MALKPRQQQVLAAMRTGIPLYHDRKAGGCYLQPVKGQATEPVDPFTVKQLIAGKYIRKTHRFLANLLGWLVTGPN
jgi:hypothetical protein